jgi:polar amino acid transport system substrate-binding protein
MPAGTFMRRIQDHGALVVGVDQNSKGLGYFNPTTSPPRMEGFDIDLVREVARAIFGTPEVVYKAISTKQRESVIVNRDVDIVASAYSITCQRRRRMRFSAVYHRARQRLLVPRDSPAQTLADRHLRHEKVCATVASTSLARLREEKDVIAHPVALRSDCLVALQEGDVAAITSDDAILTGFRQQDRQTRIVGRCLGVERYGMAINKAHPEFVRFVNAVLARLRRTGAATRLRRRWLGTLRPPNAAEIGECGGERR